MFHTGGDNYSLAANRYLPMMESDLHLLGHLLKRMNCSVNKQISILVTDKQKWASKIGYKLIPTVYSACA